MHNRLYLRFIYNFSHQTTTKKTDWRFFTFNPVCTAQLKYREKQKLNWRMSLKNVDAFILMENSAILIVSNEFDSQFILVSSEQSARRLHLTIIGKVDHWHIMVNSCLIYNFVISSEYQTHSQLWSQIAKRNFVLFLQLQWQLKFKNSNKQKFKKWQLHFIYIRDLKWTWMCTM